MTCTVVLLVYSSSYRSFIQDIWGHTVLSLWSSALCQAGQVSCHHVYCTFTSFPAPASPQRGAAAATTWLPAELYLLRWGETACVCSHQTRKPSAALWLPRAACYTPALTSRAPTAPWLSTLTLVWLSGNNCMNNRMQHVAMHLLAAHRLSTQGLGANPS